MRQTKLPARLGLRAQTKRSGLRDLLNQPPVQQTEGGTLQAHALRARVGGRRAKRGRVPPHAPHARVVVVGAAPAPEGIRIAQDLCAVCCFRVVHRGGVNFG